MVLRKYMGAPVKRREDPRLITGSSVYVDDLQLTGMVHVAFVRSIYAHANIKGIDASEATSMPGVVAIMTSADLENVLPSKYAAVGGDSGPAAEGGPAEAGKIPVPAVQPLAREKVRYVGEPIVAIIAENPLAPNASDHSRLLVAFTQDLGMLQGLAGIGSLVTPPEQFFVGRHAAYLHCPQGMLGSKAAAALVGKAGKSATTRNWATTLKLGALASRDRAK